MISEFCFIVHLIKKIGHTNWSNMGCDITNTIRLHIRLRATIMEKMEVDWRINAVDILPYHPAKHRQDYHSHIEWEEHHEKLAQGNKE